MARARAGLLLIGLVTIGLAGVLVADQRGAPAVAAPSTRDGVSLVTLARPPEAVASVSAPGAVPVVAPAADTTAPPAPARVPLVAPSSDFAAGEFYVHVPPVITGRLRVLVALHGMGQEGRAFCEAMLARADQEGWLVVAPTYAYGDWRDPNQVAREESGRFVPRLHEFLNELPARTGLDLEPRAALLGFSRGAQLAQRFAMVYPEQTLAVVAYSAGSYTLPVSQTQVQGRTVALPYPFGTADLRERFGRRFDSGALQSVPFLVGVGADDQNPADLPRQWDPYLGSNRVARAQAFAGQLSEIGVPVEFVPFPGTGHVLTDPMRLRAIDFIAGLPTT